MSIRSEISKRLLQALGPGLWKEFWVAFALKVKDAEKSYKSVPGAGKLKAAEVKAWAHARLSPLLPDFTEAAIYEYIDALLEKLVAKLNEAIGADWVTTVEDLEHFVASHIEPLLGVDLDEDGVVGAGPAKIGAVVLALAFLSGSAGPCHAVDHRHRPLVEHNRIDEDTGLPLPSSAGSPKPRSEDPGVRPSPLTNLTVGTWTGFTTNGRGHDSWNGGLAVTLKASAFQPSFLAGKGGVGAGLAYRRVGVCAFWDGTLTGGLYLRPFDL